MNLSGIGSLLGGAIQLLGTSPLGALGSLASGAVGGSQLQTSATDQSDPFSAIVALTKDVDGLATSGGLGSLLGSISGLLA